MKSLIFSALVLFGGSVFSQPLYKLFSSGSNLGIPKGKGGYVDQSGNKLVVMCDQTSDICLIKLDSLNQTIWSKKYRIFDTDEDVSPNIVENNDSYFLVGNTGYWPNQVDGLILKVRKSDGVCTMAKKFGGSMRDMFSSGIKASESSLVVCGLSLNDSFIASSGLLYRGDGILLELSWSLDTLRTFRLGANNRFDQFNLMHRALNGDLLLLGVKSPPLGSSLPDNEDLTLVRLSSLWTPLVARSYHQPVSSFEQPSAIFEGLGGRIFLVSKLPTLDQTGIIKLSASGTLISSVAVNNASCVGAILTDSGILGFGQKSSSKGVMLFVDTASFALTLSRLYTFGSPLYASISSVKKTGGEIVGFGFSHGITKATVFKADEQGSIQSCDGFVDNTFTTSPLSVNVTRPFTFQTGRFRYTGLNVSVTTEDITTNEFVCESSVLPVELVMFRAEANPLTGVNLLWSTASELRTSHFVIEKSQDGLVFDSVGVVNAVGYSMSLESYQWFDGDTERGVRYYRLRSVDEDGLEGLSFVIPVTFDSDVLRPFVFPNPASQTLTIEGGVGPVVIVNILGQVVSTQPAPKIDVSTLPKGTYTLLLIESGSKVRLVVE